MEEVILSNLSTSLRTHPSFQWRRLFFNVHSLWLLHSWIIWRLTSKNGTTYKIQRIAVQIICFKNYKELPFVISIQLQFALHFINLSCKLCRSEYNGRSMASEDVGHFMSYTTSKACYQTTYGLRTPNICNHYFLLTGDAHWRSFLPFSEGYFDSTI